MSPRWVPAPPPVLEPGGFPAPPAAGRVKVLHVITRLEAGAGGNTLLSVIGMDRGRYETWVAGGADGPLWEQARRAGVRTVEIPGLVRSLRPRQDVQVLRALTALVRRERFAVVHVHSAKAGVLGRLAGVMAGAPVIVCTIHGRDPWWPAAPGGSDLAGRLPEARAGFLLIERALRPVTHAFVGVSPTVARDAVLARVAAPGRTYVAPSAVDLGTIPTARDPRARADLGLPPDAQVVGTVGRLDAQKAPLDFVRMAAAVVAARPGVRFVHIGDGELADAVSREARRLGVPLLLAGFRPDAARLASAFDVYVVSSLYEGVGRGVTEAMASGALSSRPPSTAWSTWSSRAPPGCWRPPATCLPSLPQPCGCSTTRSRRSAWVRRRATACAHCSRPRRCARRWTRCTPACSAWSRSCGCGRRTASRPVDSVASAGGSRRDRRAHTDVRSTNWRYVVPGEPTGPVVVGADSMSLSAVLAGPPVGALAVPDLGMWAAQSGAGRHRCLRARRVLADLCSQVAPGGWVCVGFANRWYPAAAFARGSLGLGTVHRVLDGNGLAVTATYVALPDHRHPALLVPGERGAELDHRRGPAARHRSRSPACVKPGSGAR